MSSDSSLPPWSVLSSSCSTTAGGCTRAGAFVCGFQPECTPEGFFIVGTMQAALRFFVHLTLGAPCHAPDIFRFSFLLIFFTSSLKTLRNGHLCVIGAHKELQRVQLPDYKSTRRYSRPNPRYRYCPHPWERHHPPTTGRTLRHGRSSQRTQDLHPFDDISPTTPQSEQQGPDPQ